MHRSRIPSPARSQGPPLTPRRYKSRSTRSEGSPARSTISGRLTSVLDQFRETNRDSIVPSPLRKSILSDNTEIIQPRRGSWWKEVDNSRDVTEVFENNKAVEVNNVLDEIDVEVLSQEKKEYTMDIPDSSDCESISSIVIPQRKLFTQKENQPQNRFNQVQGTRESLAKHNKTDTGHDKTANVGPRNLFNRGSIRPKPVFPAALLNMSPDKTGPNKTIEVTKEVQGQPRNLFGNRPATKRKNIFADFVVSESDEDISEIQPKIFAFQKNLKPVRHSTSRHVREHSPTSSITTEMEMDDWMLLPSSTMVEHQIEATTTSTPGKNLKLSKLSEAKESDTTNSNLTVNRTRQSNSNVSKNKSITLPDIANEETAANKSISPNNKSQSFANLGNKAANDELNATQNKNESGINNISQKSVQAKLITEENDEIYVFKNHTQILNKTANKQFSRSSNVDKEPEIETQVEKNVQTEKIRNVIENITSVTAKEPEEQDNNDEDFTLKYDDNEQPAEVVEYKTVDKIVQCTEVEIEENIVEENVIDAGDKPTHSNKDASAVIHEEHKIIEETEEPENADVSEKRINEEKETSKQQSQICAGDVSNCEDNDQEELKSSIHEEELDAGDQAEIEIEIEEETQGSDNEKEGSDAEQEEEIEIEDNQDHDTEVSVNQEAASENDEQIETDQQQTDDEQADEIDSDNETEIEHEISDNDAENESQEIEQDNHVEENEEKESLLQSDEEEPIDDGIDNSYQGMEDHESDAQNESQEMEDHGSDAQNESQEHVEDEREGEIQESDEVQDDDNEVHQDHFENQEQNQETEEQLYEAIDGTPNISHDTSGRNRRPDDLKSPEIPLSEKTNHENSFLGHRNNTSIRKTKSILRKFSMRPSIAPPRESTGLSDGTKNSSAEGSGWDSHRTTRKTLRQTFGRDFTPRKSLRALVMEKSAKRQTAINDANIELQLPQANSTELPVNVHHVDETYEENVEVAEESDHELSRREAFEVHLQQFKNENMEMNLRIEQRVKNMLKFTTKTTDYLTRSPNKALRRINIRPLQYPSKKQTKRAMIALENLPPEFIEDMKYKPPKRFKANAAWITNRLYKFLESKLEPKYDYKARVRAEKLVEMIYHFTRDIRKLRVAPPHAVTEIKRELARLDIVRTHFEFYDFIREYLPQEIKVKIVPDIVNDIPLPRNGVFAEITF